MPITGYLAEEGYLKAAYVPKKDGGKKKTGDQETESGEEKKQAGKGNETEIELDGGEKARAFWPCFRALKRDSVCLLQGWKSKRVKRLLQEVHFRLHDLSHGKCRAAH